MAVCLDYQSVYVKKVKTVSNRLTILASFFLMSVLIFHVWIRSEKISLGYNIAAAQNKTEEYNTIKKDLAMQLSVVERYDNLMDIASKRLGFSQESKSQIFTLEY